MVAAECRSECATTRSRLLSAFPVCIKDAGLFLADIIIQIGMMQIYNAGPLFDPGRFVYSRRCFMLYQEKESVWRLGSGGDRNDPRDGYFTERRR